MRYPLALFVIFGLFLSFAAPAAAQSPVEIERLQIDIWPEYDRPEVLVIYRIALSSKTSLPAQLSLRIPSQAERPYNLAMQDVDGQLYNLDYTLSAQGEWLVVSFITPAPDLQLEYYDPRLDRSQPRRSYEYRWAGDYDVRSLVVQVQQPVSAAEMLIAPNLGSGRPGQDDLIYYTAMIGEVKAGITFGIRLEYEKTDERLSSNLQPVQPSQPLGLQTIGRTNFLSVLPWALAVVGLLLIAGGLFWYWQSGREPPLPERQPQTPPPRKESSAEGDQGAAMYCHQCGKRATPGDIFCRTCGTKLRYE